MVCAALSAQTANRLQNPGFETYSGPADPNWHLDSQVIANGSAALSGMVLRSGQSALQLTPNARNSDSVRTSSGFSLAQVLPADTLRGQNLYLSGWMRTTAPARAVIRIYYLATDGRVAFQEMRESSSSAFVLHRDIFAVPNDPAIAYILVGCIVEGTSGAAYFDDLSLTTEVPASWLEANGTPDPGGPYEATITVNPASVVRNIPTTLYGTNLEWVWDGNGLWDAASNQLNPQLLSLSKQLGSTLYRFPGGFFSDYYHWRDGIGPQSTRPQTLAMPGGPVSVHHFGTDEAWSLANSHGANLLITVNVVTGTAQEAADWVRYVNKGSRRVNYWEIGNESYMTGTAGFVASSMLTPDVYASRVVEFARAMRAADPKIKIGAIADENYSRTAVRSFPDWTDKVLSIAGSEIDFLSVHAAYAPGLSADLGWNARTVYSATLAAPGLIASQLQDLSRRIAVLAPSRRIKIAVTEWGPYFDYRPECRFVDHPKTLGSALYTASALKAFVENANVDVANLFKLVDQNFMGIIGMRQGSYAAKASYYALQMFTQHFGPVLVSTATSAPAYDSPTVGWADAAAGVPYLEALSSTSADGRTLYLLVINKHFDRDIHARISTGNFSPSGSGTVYTLNGTGLDANTGTELLAVDGVTWARQTEVLPNPRFYSGGPGEVSVSTSTLSGITGTFDYTFPAHSVTSIALPRK